MRFVKNYLKENLKWLLLVLACFGILCFVIGFEQVPLAQWGYAAFLCFFLYLLVVIIDFTRRYLHHKKLEKQTSEIAVTMDKLSLPQGQMETVSDFQRLLQMRAVPVNMHWTLSFMRKMVRNIRLIYLMQEWTLGLVSIQK